MEPKEDNIGYYFTKSDISLMKIRVNLEEFSTTQILKKSFVELTRKASTDENFGVHLRKLSEQGESDVRSTFQETVMVKWQEKILNPSERHKRAHRGESEEEDIYDNQSYSHRKRKGPSRIFTYVDSDDYITQEYPPTTSKSESSQEFVLRNRFRHLSLREVQSEEERKVTFFHIMADLSPEESFGETSENEVVLCKMKYDVRGELLVDPDFSNGERKPYRITGIGDGNTIYEYTISIVTEKPFEDELEAAKTPPITLPKAPIMPSFDRIDGPEVRFLFLGEVTRAVNFIESSSPLYFQYQLHLPPGWRSENDSHLDGMSESCWPILDENHRRSCHFSFPLNFCLRRSKEGNVWPSLLFAVFHKEWLTHDKDAGFGVLPLPYPGFDILEDKDTDTEKSHYHPSTLAVIRAFHKSCIRLKSVKQNISTSLDTNKGMQIHK